MNSLSTIEQQNLDTYWALLQQIDPELYLIKTLLHETGMNPLVLPKIIRSLSNLAMGTGYGKIEIFMTKRVVTAVNGQERDVINQDVLKHLLESPKKQ